MEPENDWKIRLLQENLSAIRKVARWTTERLGAEIGVTRQTISNLERGKTPMTKTQYLALRWVFFCEAAENDKPELATIIKALVDDPVEEDSSFSQVEEKEEDGAPHENQKNAMSALSEVTRAASKSKEIERELRKIRLGESAQAMAPLASLGTLLALMSLLPNAK